MLITNLYWKSEAMLNPAVLTGLTSAVRERCVGFSLRARVLTVTQGLCFILTVIKSSSK